MQRVGFTRYEDIWQERREAMMGPDYTHWHGMYEVAKHFYVEFLPAVVEVAATGGHTMETKYKARVAELLAQEEHIWLQGLSAEEAALLRETYRDRYDQ
jgi:hydroxylamine dehydrogenase